MSLGAQASCLPSLNATLCGCEFNQGLNELAA